MVTERRQNTRFFHRHRHNRITSLKIDSGEWTTDRHYIESTISSHFANLYTTVQVKTSTSYPIATYNFVSESDSFRLESPLTDHEIYTMLYFF